MVCHEEPGLHYASDNFLHGEPQVHVLGHSVQPPNRSIVSDEKCDLFVDPKLFWKPKIPKRDSPQLTLPHHGRLHCLPGEVLKVPATQGPTVDIHRGSQDDVGTLALQGWEDGEARGLKPCVSMGSVLADSKVDSPEITRSGDFWSRWAYSSTIDLSGKFGWLVVREFQISILTRRCPSKPT